MRTAGPSHRIKIIWFPDILYVIKSKTHTSTCARKHTHANTRTRTRKQLKQIKKIKINNNMFLILFPSDTFRCFPKRCRQYLVALRIHHHCPHFTSNPREETREQNERFEERLQPASILVLLYPGGPPTPLEPNAPRGPLEMRSLLHSLLLGYNTAPPALPEPDTVVSLYSVFLRQ